MSTISDIAPLHLKFAPELYLKRKVAPVFPFGREHLGLIIPTETTSQLLDILGMGSYNNYRER